MNVFFDVDYTLLCDIGLMRPNVRDVFEHLKRDGDDIYIWSGMGLRTREIEKHGLREFVSGVFVKPLWDYQLLVDKMVVQQQLPVAPDLVVDDHDEFVSALGGIVIKPYWHPEEPDSEMLEVYRVICELRDRGTSNDPRFRPHPRLRPISRELESA